MNPDRIFADNNLFLRYLTNDIPEQASAIEALLREVAGGHFNRFEDIDIRGPGEK
jgi:hypothetical protein